MQKASIPRFQANRERGERDAASQTALSAPALMRLIEDAGLPPGVLNQMTGPAEAASNLTNLSLELGGQAPAIVFTDADFDLAVDKVFSAKFRNGGRVIYGGNRLSDGEYARGWFVAPCVAVDVKDDMCCMCEETFGPLAPIARFRETEEVIQRANATPYGLSAYLYTSNLRTAFEVGEKLEAGTVAVNDDVPSTTIAPFGGYKQSGLGRECGIEGIEAFLETKHLSVRL